nr:RpiB/LacA/LacB family sugar-phosphate isomerase [Thioclava sp. F42-5]
MRFAWLCASRPTAASLKALCCGTGIGVCLSANKVPGIRAAQTHDTYSAGKAATSNNAHIITMGAWVVGAELAKDIADAFLASSFDPEGKSADNVQAIDAVDAKYHTTV